MPLPGIAGGILGTSRMYHVLRCSPMREFTSSSPASASLCVLLFTVIVLPWLASVEAMRPGRVADLRQETVDMFYHGFDNYMKIAFPEDEVWHIHDATSSHHRS